MPLQGRAGMAAQAVSLGVTALILWDSVIGRRLLNESLPAVIGNALFYAFLAWCWSAAITLLLFLLLPRGRAGRILPRTLCTASVAVWFAPACILLSQLSPATLLASLALVAAATRLFYSEWLAASPPPEPPLPTAPIGLFGENAPRSPVITRELASGIAAALSLQCGVVSIWEHRPLIAGAWFVMSTAILTLFALVSGVVSDATPRGLPRSALGVLATILLAACITVGGVRWMRGHGNGVGAGSGLGPVASAREVLRQLFGPDEPSGGAASAPVPPAPPLGPANAPDGSFPGVILWPEVSPVTRLVVPLPRAYESAAATPASSYSIPFDGQYLLYRWPFSRPPVTSILERGSPVALGFRTTDQVPLNMDAIQRFDEPVDLSCCTRVRVEAWNADRYPNTVSLDLLANGQPLGNEPIRSHPDLSRDPVDAVPESLDFPIPPGIPPVTELRIVFRRMRVRVDKSARIAIDRFVLLR